MRPALWLFLRRFLVLFGGSFAGAVLIQQLALQRLAPLEDDYWHEVVRGQLHHLRADLGPLSPSARLERIAELKPHYGLQLQLLARADVQLGADEQAQLAARQVVIRADGDQFLTPLDGHTLLQVDVPPNPLKWHGLALGTLPFMLTMALLVGWWVRRHRHDLRRVTLAARRIGGGELSARVALAPGSELSTLGGDLNAMAARLELLIGAQRQLVQGVAHELRTPIARIGFALDLLADEAEPAARAQRVESIREDLRELDALIYEMLSYARLQQIDQPLRREMVDTAAWLDSVLGMVVDEAQSRQVSVEARGPLPGRVSLEPRLMARAALNLLRNALRYAAARVEVRIDILGWDTVLTVDDDGPGIAPTDRARLLEPFVRLDESRNRDSGGFGLGLAIVNQVARAHGGQVVVDDSPIGGARFILRWPTEVGR
ncbi:MAG: ATP-binding protein [Rhodocyclaceae bacterium]